MLNEKPALSHTNTGNLSNVQNLWRAHFASEKVIERFSFKDFKSIAIALSRKKYAIWSVCSSFVF